MRSGLEDVKCTVCEYFVCLHPDFCIVCFLSLFFLNLLVFEVRLGALDDQSLFGNNAEREVGRFVFVSFIRWYC